MTKEYQLVLHVLNKINQVMLSLESELPKEAAYVGKQHEEIKKNLLMLAALVKQPKE